MSYFITHNMPTIGQLKPPDKMPASQIQRIKNLTCPPPILPSKVSDKLTKIQQKMADQTKKISILEEQIEALEARLNISFSANPEIKFDLQPGQIPYIDVSGTVENVVLDFHLWPARKGIQGIQGEQGSQGIQGPYNEVQGTPGIPGYYGIRGNSTK